MEAGNRHVGTLNTGYHHQTTNTNINSRSSTCLTDMASRLSVSLSLCPLVSKTLTSLRDSPSLRHFVTPFACSVSVCPLSPLQLPTGTECR